jgi:hypothetical protein
MRRLALCGLTAPLRNVVAWASKAIDTFKLAKPIDFVVLRFPRGGNHGVADAARSNDAIEYTAQKRTAAKRSQNLTRQPNRRQASLNDRKQKQLFPRYRTPGATGSPEYTNATHWRRTA